MGHSVCCIPFCPNTGKNSKFSFYTFPSAIKRPDQRKKWLSAVRLRNCDGSEWIPTRSNTICSEHFVGNKKSLVPNSPAYVPTIFPKKYKCKTVNAVQVLNRYNRYKNRSYRLLQKKTDDPMSLKVIDKSKEEGMHDQLSNPRCAPNLKSLITVQSYDTDINRLTNKQKIEFDESVCDLNIQMDKGCQVYIIDKNNESHNIIKETFSCNTYVISGNSKCDAQIQTEITLPRRVKVVCNNCSGKKFKSKMCQTSQVTYKDTANGTDIDDESKEKNTHFSIKNEQELLDFAGTNESFNILLKEEETF